MDEFVKGLREKGKTGPYNSDRKGYDDWLRGRYKDVQKWKEACGVK